MGSTVRFTKPSFSTKNCTSVVISRSGRFLAQFGQRISIYDIQERELVAEHKVITNDSYIGFSEDEELMFSKNTNGEIAFFKTLDGARVSYTGKFHHYGEGSQPQFCSDGTLLYDPTWRGGLKVWDTRFAKCIDEYDFDGWTLSALLKLNDRQMYVFSTSSKHPSVGHSRLYAFCDGPAPLKFDEMHPDNSQLKNGTTWHDIDTFAACANGPSLFLSVRPKGECGLISRVNLDNGANKFAQLEAPNIRIASMASNGAAIAAVAHTYSDSKLTSGKWKQWKNENETEHLLFFDSERMELVSKIHWPEAQSVCFHPDGNGLAIASRKRSGFLHDFRLLSKQLGHTYQARHY